MNAFLLLGVLLLAVPMQLLLNHVIKSTETGASLQESALDRISDKVESLYDDIHSTVKYYSKLSHLKELFVIPHKRKKVRQKKFKETVRTFIDPSTGMQVTTIVMGSGYDDDNDDEESGSESTRTKGRGSVVNKEPGSAASRSSQYSEISHDMSPAKEVEEWNKKHLYYARSEEIRKVHPPSVKYSVGQVVQHKMDHFYGVVVGWDEKCQASREWLKMHGYMRKSEKSLQESPHYLVLVKKSESDQSELYYLPQRHLEAVNNVDLDYQDLYHYFQNYSIEEEKFVPRPWLKDRYPKG